MNQYTPDNWVVIKFDGPDPHYRVLAGWGGGYMTGDSWRLNSGITKVEERDTFYRFYGSSGSFYDCRKNSYMLRMNNMWVWEQLEKVHGSNVLIMDEKTDWTNVDYVLDTKPKNRV